MEDAVKVKMQQYYEKWGNRSLVGNIIKDAYLTQHQKVVVA